jgi:hypothetical protein
MLAFGLILNYLPIICFLKKEWTLLSEFEFSLALFRYQTCVLNATPLKSFFRTSKPHLHLLIQESILIIICKPPQAELLVNSIQIR